jgi:hypothetical protein
LAVTGDLLRFVADGPALRKRLAQLGYHRMIRGQRTGGFFGIGESFYSHLYRRVVEGMGGIGHHLLDMQELAALAQPYYHRFARGGEGHLEVAKNIYYTVHKKAHMVLSLKPFGCMPSSQSDGVQSAVMNHSTDMIFLPSKRRARRDQRAQPRRWRSAKPRPRPPNSSRCSSHRPRLEDIRAWDELCLKHPFASAARKGVTGTAANFVLYNDPMNKVDHVVRESVWHTRGAVPSAAAGVSDAVHLCRHGRRIDDRQGGRRRPATDR